MVHTGSVRHIAAPTTPAKVVRTASVAFAVLSCGIVVGPGSSAPATIRRLDGTTITTANAESFARETLAAAHVTGAQIAVLDRGRLVWSAAFGLRRREPALPMDRDTTTWAASITKGVFATYVMQLVERGEFSLDVPVARQLPRALDTYEAYRETASEMVRDPAWPTVTPRMLLAHTSGLANFAMSRAGQEDAPALQSGHALPILRRGYQPGAVRHRAAERPAARPTHAGGAVYASRDDAHRASSTGRSLRTTSPTATTPTSSSSPRPSAFPRARPVR